MQEVKGESSKWINKEGLTPQKFQWQEGYAAFSHARSQIDTVVKYIHHQQEHHRTVSFLEEYRKILDSFSVTYDERYLFKEPAD